MARGIIELKMLQEKIKRITDTVAQSIKETFKLLMTQNLGSAIKENRMSNINRKKYILKNKTIHLLYMVCFCSIDFHLYLSDDDRYKYTRFKL